MGSVMSMLGSLLLPVFIFFGACVGFLASSRERGSLAWAWRVAALILCVTAVWLFYKGVKV